MDIWKQDCNRWQFKQLDTDDILVESYDRGPKQVEVLTQKLKIDSKIIHKFLQKNKLEKKQQDV